MMECTTRATGLGPPAILGGECNGDFSPTADEERRSAFHLCLPRSFFSGADPPGSCSNSLCATLLGRTLTRHGFHMWRLLMSKTTVSVATMLLSVFACTYPLLAQVKTPLPATRPARARVVPCWEQVGISKSAIEERTA